MSLPKCEVPTRDQWSKARDKNKGKDGLSKQSMGKSLDKFHSAITTAAKTTDVKAALKACDELSKVFNAYKADVEKLSKYPDLVKYLEKNPIVLLNEFKIRLENLAEGDQDYSADIKNAQLIAEKWKKEGKQWLQKLTVKKADLDEVENWWDRVASAIAKGETAQPQVMEEMEGRVTLELKNLLKLEQEGLKIYNDFNAWAMLGPRKGYNTIDKELNLGGVARNRGMAVAKACKIILSEVSDAISKGDVLWLTEMRKQIDQLTQRGQQLKKILAGEVSLLDSERERLSKDVKAFKTEVNRQFEFELKLKVDVDLLGQVLKTTELDSQLRTKWDGRVTLLRKKQASLPNLAKFFQNEVNRIKKDLPQALEDSEDIKALDKAHEVFKTTLRQTNSVYTKAIEALEKLGMTE